MTQKILTAAEYHRATSYRRYGLTPHTLDWAYQPLPTKNYPQLDRVRLDLAADGALLYLVGAGPVKTR